MLGTSSSGALSALAFLMLKHLVSIKALFRLRERILLLSALAFLMLACSILTVVKQQRGECVCVCVCASSVDFALLKKSQRSQRVDCHRSLESSLPALTSLYWKSGIFL